MWTPCAQEIAAQDWPWLPETVYLGGGTPSRLDACDLNRILAAIPGQPWREATIEAAPGGITLELAHEWARAGINRVSLGVQSFVARELARTGRKHSAEIVAREIALLRQAGLSNVNIDLIAGLPGQTPASGRDRWTGSRSSTLRTSPSTCWKWTKTAASEVKCCSTASATARRRSPATKDRGFL